MTPKSGTTRQTASNRLSALFVKQVREPGIYLDGAGLRFQVTATGGRRWFLRATVAGKPRDFALGRAEEVSLAEAREKASVIRRAIAEGRDPAEVARPAQACPLAVPPTGPTVADVWEMLWPQRAAGLSPRTRAVWTNLTTRYVLPAIGHRPVADVRPAEIIEMLQPIWRTKEETARRTLRIAGQIFEVAIVRELRERASPTVGVTAELGRRRLSGEHFAAMPWSEVPSFVEDLRARGGLAASRLCLELLILTAARSGEARGALRSEIDLGSATWTIPASRMKMGVPHRVPLSRRALEILAEARSLSSDDLVFPNSRGRIFSDMTLLKRLRDMGLGGVATVHGFRSAFKVWCAETGVRDEVSEAALAHADRNQVRAAYRRTDYFEERRDLMERWACFVCGSTTT